METELILVLASGGVSVISHFVKKIAPKANALYFVAMVAVGLGLLYSYLMQNGVITQETVLIAQRGFAYAVVLYEMAKKTRKKQV